MDKKQKKVRKGTTKKTDFMRKTNHFTHGEVWFCVSTVTEAKNNTTCWRDLLQAVIAMQAFVNHGSETLFRSI